MKNYNEMANNVFARIDEYEINKKRKKAILLKSSVSALCVCLIAVIGFGVSRQGTYNNDNKKVAGLISFSEKGNKIVINKIEEGTSVDRAIISLEEEDFVPMSKEELEKYYGVKVFPCVPKDLKLQEYESIYGYGIFKRNEGQGDVYYDASVLNYFNEDYSRSVNIEVSKVKNSFVCYNFFESLKEKSLIKNTEVLIGVKDDLYCVAIENNGVFIQIITEGLSQDELIAVISSVVK